jgi:hypothetical protein
MTLSQPCCNPNAQVRVARLTQKAPPKVLNTYTDIGYQRMPQNREWGIQRHEDSKISELNATSIQQKASTVTYRNCTHKKLGEIIKESRRNMNLIQCVHLNTVELFITI